MEPIHKELRVQAGDDVMEWGIPFLGTLACFITVADQVLSNGFLSIPQSIVALSLDLISIENFVDMLKQDASSMTQKPNVF